jgi:hypothetical protein
LSFVLLLLHTAGLEGCTNAGLAGLPQLRRLTRLVIEAEQTPGITLRAFDCISSLTGLKQLHWCSRDSMHGPMDADALCEQLCALTGLRQLVLLTGQQVGVRCHADIVHAWPCHSGYTEQLTLNPSVAVFFCMIACCTVPAALCTAQRQLMTSLCACFFACLLAGE